MNTPKPQVAPYGLHYYANNQLIPNASDRLLFQCLLDLVRKQLSDSLDNQTVIISKRRLGQLAGLNIHRTVPQSLSRLEVLGLVKLFKNGIKIYCDEYVALVQYYESLDYAEREEFADQFSKSGIGVLQKCNIDVNPGARRELLGMAGNSISKCCTYATFSESEGESIAEVQHFQNRKAKMLQKCNIASSPNADSFCGENVALMQHFTKEMAKMLHKCNIDPHDIGDLEDMNVAEVQHWPKEELVDAIREAVDTGKFAESILNDPQKCCTYATLSVALVQHWTSKSVALMQHSNNIYNNINNKGSEAPYIGGENKKNIFEGFEKVEVIDFDKLSSEEQEALRDELIIDDCSQLSLKRAERKMKARNPYRNKPFLKLEKVLEVIDCLDEVVKSPVDFFLYQFCWGIFDLYCDHYHFSQRIDEEGELEEEPQQVDWKEIAGAPLPQDEIYSLAKNVYEDLLGAVEQGQYVYGNNNEWVVKFGFESFEDFNPYEMFQWTPCTMQDKSIPALRVAFDRFYDIEAKDVFTPSKGDKREKNSQNKKLLLGIMAAKESELSPMEAAIRNFYETFVVTGEDNVIDEFTDSKGIKLESGGGLPDHLLKPWCFDIPKIGYGEFTGVLSSKYKPCDGIHKKAHIFSAEAVVEWNERNGYHDTIAHQAIQA